MGFFNRKHSEDFDSETVPAKKEAVKHRKGVKPETQTSLESHINNLILQQARNEDERQLFEEKMRQLGA
jgi:hypothetical protein